MYKTIIIRGLTLGIVAGLVVTFFDGVLMLRPSTYVPPDHPFVLISFNVLFWAVFGALSGFALCAVKLKKKDIDEKNDFYWVLFFLIPFAVAYGVLGRLHIPPIPLTFVHPGHVFDYHLSFVWPGIIIAFLLFYLQRKGSCELLSPRLFIVEILFFTHFFYTCSNMQRISRRVSLRAFHSLFASDMFSDVFLYTVVVLGTLGLYFFLFFTVVPMVRIRFIAKNSAAIACLCICVAVFVGLCYAASQRHRPRMHFSANAAHGVRNEKHVSNVILIVLDTLRADRLSLYGHPGTSKNLEAFAEDSLVFEQCVAPGPWTLPSHVSLFTGLYTSEHMCTEDLRETWPDVTPIILADEYKTLAEIFHDNGYSTAAVVSNHGWLNSSYNVNQGFQLYDCNGSIGTVYMLYPFRPILHIFSYLTNIYPKSIKSYRTADDINRIGLNVLEKLRDRPFFLFLNYMDVHGPYRPPKPYDGFFLNSSFPQMYRLRQYGAYLKGKHDKSEWDSYLLSQYDGEIMWLDSQLGELFARLKEMGLYDSSLIIVTSDHGEMFGEHGFYTHNCVMYEGVIKIPLIIKLPFSKRVEREKKIINLTDVFSTILSICDLPVPDGVSAKPFGGDTSSCVAEYHWHVFGEHRTLYDGNYKFMSFLHKKEHGKKEYQKQRSPELYDLAKDPLEKENLAKKLPEVVAAMQAKLKTWEDAHPRKKVDQPKSKAVLSEDVKEGLRALGYVQ
jgi:arylsulfatase A-like enzyme